MAFSSSARGPAASEHNDGLLLAIEGGRNRAEPPTRLAKLVSEHLDFVWRSLRRFGVREADVDDAAQRVFLVANDKLSKIEAGRERAFLIGIATRIASHARRGYQRRELLEMRLSSSPHPANPDPEELTQQLQARELLDRALDGMQDDLRAVFVLFELEELSVDEIARLLSLPRGTAATRLRRAREVFHERARLVALEHQTEVRRGR